MITYQHVKVAPVDILFIIIILSPVTFVLMAMTCWTTATNHLGLIQKIIKEWEQKMYKEWGSVQKNTPTIQTSIAKVLSGLLHDSRYFYLLHWEVYIIYVCTSCPFSGRIKWCFSNPFYNNHILAWPLNALLYFSTNRTITYQHLKVTVGKGS